MSNPADHLLRIEHGGRDGGSHPSVNHQINGGIDDLADRDQNPALANAVPNPDVSAASGFRDRYIAIENRDAIGFEILTHRNSPSVALLSERCRYPHTTIKPRHSNSAKGLEMFIFLARNFTGATHAA